MKPIYPRMLFPAGDAALEPCIVADADAEAAARAEGYAIAGEVAAPKAKPAKKSKAAE